MKFRDRHPFLTRLAVAVPSVVYVMTLFYAVLCGLGRVHLSIIDLILITALSFFCITVRNSLYSRLYEDGGSDCDIRK